MDENIALVEINKAQQALERANDIHEMLDLRDRALAFQILANARGFKEAAQEAKIYQLKAERKAGEWLAEHVSAGNPQLLPDATIGALPDGIDRFESHRWQLEAKVPEEHFNEWIDDCIATGKEISAAGLQRLAQNPPFVAHNTGNNEWYTPAEYIEAARQVMGTIELDPASSNKANQIVKALYYYTEQEDGLAHAWSGKVWMNPPYAADLVGKFVEKLVSHHVAGEVTEAIVLVNNATETRWFQLLLSHSPVMCFVKQRIKFIDIEGNPSSAPLQGQAILYLGQKVESFEKHFLEFGAILYGYLSRVPGYY